LLVEGLLGVLLPVALKLTVHAGWALSLVNCFAGGVFFSFGERQSLPSRSTECGKEVDTNASPLGDVNGNARNSQRELLKPFV